jgi:hypothetical protein
MRQGQRALGINGAVSGRRAVHPRAGAGARAVQSESGRAARREGGARGGARCRGGAEGGTRRRADGGRPRPRRGASHSVVFKHPPGEGGGARAEGVVRRCGAGARGAAAVGRLPEPGSPTAEALPSKRRAPGTHPPPPLTACTWASAAPPCCSTRRRPRDAPFRCWTPAWTAATGTPAGSERDAAGACVGGARAPLLASEPAGLQAGAPAPFAGCPACSPASRARTLLMVSAGLQPPFCPS